MSQHLKTLNSSSVVLVPGTETETGTGTELKLNFGTDTTLDSSHLVHSIIRFLPKTKLKLNLFEKTIYFNVVMI